MEESCEVLLINIIALLHIVHLVLVLESVLLLQLLLILSHYTCILKVVFLGLLLQQILGEFVAFTSLAEASIPGPHSFNSIVAESIRTIVPLI